MTVVAGVPDSIRRFQLLTRRARGELVDMIAIARFVRGDDVALTDLERRVAIHAAFSCGVSKDTIAKRCRVHDRKITEELARPWPTDSLNRPLTLTIRL